MCSSTTLEPIPGWATAQGTHAYAGRHAGPTARGHFSDFLSTRILLSSIGVGTFPGQASPEVDVNLAQVVSGALRGGINVVDTAAHYRYGRSLTGVGAGVRAALAHGVPREAMFLVSKGGFLTFRGGIPADREAWFDHEIVDRGLGTREDLVGAHLLTPEYLHYQIDLSRALMGVATLDAFLVDQPEVHIPVHGKEALNRKLLAVFVELERAVAQGTIRYYGISTFEALRVDTDGELFQSLTSLQGLAEKAVRAVAGDAGAHHHFALVQMPFNQVMLEGFSRFNTATGRGNVASPLQAAGQLGIYVMASHTLMKGHLACQTVDVVEQSLGDLANPAQRAIQFNRSTPGVGTTLVGMSTPAHLEDALAVAACPPMDRRVFLGMFGKVD